MASINILHRSDRRAARVKKVVLDYADTFNKTKKFSPEFRKRLTGEILAIFEENVNKNNHADPDKIQRQLNETYSLRSNFAKTAIKEYFTELTNDYYFFTD